MDSLLTKLNARDWEYLKGFGKYEPPIEEIG